ncbi:hypothetical protein CLOM_g6470 [Closterium sp. NIES-68]|nr:hypothetical protein CLOM_g6470 [Closterium sp. NIES-68]
MREEEMLMEEELYLRRQELAAISMRPGDDVKPVLDKIKDTYARMAAAGSSVSQLQQCTKIISVLDNPWDNLIPTLNSQQDQWTPEWLRRQILQEDFRRRHVGGLSANLLSVRRLQKSKAEVTFGPTSCRAKLGKKMLWILEEETSCIKDLWQLPIIPWNGKTPTAATAAIEEDEIAHCYWAPIPEPKTREEALNGPNGEKWKTSEDEEFGKLFHSMVGSLSYAANHTRPDIAFATSRLASVVSRPSHEQQEAAKRLVRYIVKTHQQAADIFTKRLADADHWKGMKLAGMSVH